MSCLSLLLTTPVSSWHSRAMDAYETRIVELVTMYAGQDDNYSYAKATGLRQALEIYSGEDRARMLLFGAGHEY